MVPIYRLSVDQYHRMIDAGILTEDDDVELLEGWLVPKMPKTPPHDGTIDALVDLLRAWLPSTWFPRAQAAITLPDSEPEPDVAIVAGSRRTFMTRHPTTADVAWLVEVAYATLTEDRRDKGRIYARAGIPIYWIVNLVDEQIEVYSDPDSVATPPRYRQRQDYQRGQHVPLVVPGLQPGRLLVDDVLP